MSKEEFSRDQNQGSGGSRRHREEFEGIQQESREDGEKMQKKGAHSNKGIGDERNPIRESHKE
ncbi:MAG TPA: hypothetical protein VK947_00150 [Planococcus sp. (in: firmicutes)]|nr:hypothetical protein [Planococcus sp. (in: firmicutes)]